MRSMFDDAVRSEILGRLRALRPDAERRWGTMTAPRMVAHLIDQMSHTLADVPVEDMPGWMRNPVIKIMAIYVLPWPKGRIKGPAGAFVTKPGQWSTDLTTLEKQLARLAEKRSQTQWPDHPKFGAMNGRDWAVFCYKHFDHHLRQFGG